MPGDRRRYRGAHRAVRRAGLPYAYGQLCCRCGEPMLAGQELDLDHRDDGVGYRGFAHAVCNRSAGGKLGALGRREQRRRIMELGRVAVAVEVAWDRSHTAVAAAGVDGDATQVELVDYVEGTDAGGLLLGWWRTPSVEVLVVDPGSPAATFIAGLQRARVKLVEPQARDVTVATGELLDGLRAGTIRVAAQPALEAAVRHARAREVAAGIAFDRRGDVDASPLLAATLACWAARRLPKPVGKPRLIVAS